MMLFIFDIALLKGESKKAQKQRPPQICSSTALLSRPNRLKQALLAYKWKINLPCKCRICSVYSIKVICILQKNHFVVFHLTDQPQQLQRLGMFRAGGDEIYPRRIDG